MDENHYFLLLVADGDDITLGSYMEALRQEYFTVFNSHILCYNRAVSRSFGPAVACLGALPPASPHGSRNNCERVSDRAGCTE